MELYMKRIFISFIAAFSVLVLGNMSCQSGGEVINKSTKGIGKLKLNVSSDGKDYVEVTKANGGVDTDDFGVVIKDASGEVVNSWDRFADVDEIIGLKNGEYSVEATSGEMVSAGWDAPHYSGQQNFSITPEQITAVNLICALDNAKVTLEYTQEFKDYFQGDFEIRLVNADYTSENTPIVFSASETRSAYIKPQKFELLFTSPKAPSHATVIETVNPKDHHIVTFNVKPVGDAMLNMTVDVTTKDINLDLEVPTDEEDLGNGGNMPDQPGGGDETDPTPETVTVQGVGFDIAQPLIISDATDFANGACTKPVQVNLTASAGIGELWVEIDSPDLSEELLNAAIGAKKFDIANAPDNIRSNLIMLKVIKETDVIKGANSFVFDVTAFMSLLSVNSITHDFHITLVDSQGNSSGTKTLSISRTE